MKPSRLLACLGLSFILTPALAWAAESNTITFDLIGTLESKPAGYSGPSFGVLGTPTLSLNKGDSSGVLYQALRNIEHKEQSLSVDDSVIIVGSALKAADADASGHLEEVMGFSDRYIHGVMKTALPKNVVQSSYEKYSQTVQKTKRVAATLVSVVIGVAGVGLMIPLAFTGIGLIPGLLLAGAGFTALQGSSQMLRNINAENRPIVASKMGEMMIGVLGAEQAEPGAKVSWTKFNYLPAEELISRTKHAVWEKRIITEYVSKYSRSPSKSQKLVIDTLHTLYGRDLLISEMLLSALSRQVAGVSVEKVSATNALMGNRATELLAGLVYLMTPDELAALSVTTEGLATHMETFLGLPGYREKGEEIRKKEIAFTTTWLKALIFEKLSGRVYKNAEQLETAVGKVLKADAYLQNFAIVRAQQTLIDHMNGAADAEDTTGVLNFLRRQL